MEEIWRIALALFRTSALLYSQLAASTVFAFIRRAIRVCLLAPSTCMCLFFAQFGFIARQGYQGWLLGITTSKDCSNPRHTHQNIIADKNRIQATETRRSSPIMSSMGLIPVFCVLSIWTTRRALVSIQILIG